MSPRAMGEFIIRAAEAFDLEHPHLVGPDSPRFLARRDGRPADGN